MTVWLTAHGGIKRKWIGCLRKSEIGWAIPIQAEAMEWHFDLGQHA